MATIVVVCMALTALGPLGKDMSQDEAGLLIFFMSPVALVFIAVACLIGGVEAFCLLDDLIHGRRPWKENCS